MKTTIFTLLIVIILSWVSATSRPFPPYYAAHHQDTGQTLHSPQVGFDSNQGSESMKRVLLNRSKDEEYKGLSRLGSRPPNCEHKCGSCKPCDAIQVPTTTDHLGVLYANYEPEGWKCKCGSSFFNP